MSKLIEAQAKIEDVCRLTDYEGIFQVSFDRGWVKDGFAIISRKRYEREMAQRKAEIDLLNHQMAKLVEEICRLHNDVIGMQIRMEQFDQEDGPAEAEQEDTVLTIHCKECRHAIETLDGRLVCEHDNQEHDPDWCCNKVD